MLIRSTLSCAWCRLCTLSVFSGAQPAVMHSQSSKRFLHVLRQEAGRKFRLALRHSVWLLQCQTEYLDGMLRYCNTGLKAGLENSIVISAKTGTNVDLIANMHVSKIPINPFIIIRIRINYMLLRLTGRRTDVQPRVSPESNILAQDLCMK